MIANFMTELLLIPWLDSEETTYVTTIILVFIVPIISILPPVLAIWMTIKGKLPGTKKE